MAINGKYNVTIDTPIGPQNGSVTFKSEGAVLHGDYQIAGSNGNFTGTADGENAKWAMTVPDPMGGNITLTFDVKVTSTDLSGSGILGPYGTSSVRGKKA
jgi:hypothetical protein